MSNREKFLRFCGVWVTYPILSFPLLKWILVPAWGDACVAVAVAIGLVAWGTAFLRWGPIRGNWDCEQAQGCLS